MYTKVDPGHQPATKDVEQPVAKGCSCSCNCSCNCPSGGMAVNQSRRQGGLFMEDNDSEAIVPT